MKGHSVQDLFRMKVLSEVTLSPDANRLAYVSSNYHKEFKGILENEAVLQDLNSGEERTLSDTGTASSSMAFSPDSSRLSFVFKDAKNTYLRICGIKSGSSEDIRPKGKIISAQWSDESSLLLLIEDENREKEKKVKSGDDGYFFEEDHQFQSLWSYTPGKGMKRITSGIQVWDYATNGGTAAAITSPLPYNWSWYESDISTIDLGTGSVNVLYKPEKRQLSHPRISQDGTKVHFIESLMSDNGVESGDIISCSVADGKSENLTDGMEKSFTSFHEAPDGRIYALGNNMGTFEIMSLGGTVHWSKYGSVSPLFSPKFSMAGDRFTLAFTSSGMPMEVILTGKDGKEKVATARNSHLGDLVKQPAKLVKWKASDGMEVYGIFRNAGKDTPLVVIVHGGPTSSSTENFLDFSTILASSGFSVFMPNYRGSTGKGRKYAELNRGDMGGKDFSDIMEGIDHLLETEKLDGKRLYITGGSYGGFMSAWAITQTDRFRACVSLFGISDWISFHGVSSLAVWDSIHYDQDPYAFDRFVKFSPIRYLDRVKTPILMMHGIEDPYVPVGQYYQFYRALKDKGKEARLLLFPREGHGFREKSHVEMYMSEAVKYFNEFK